jgi:hypothetical protein
MALSWRVFREVIAAIQLSGLATLFDGHQLASCHSTESRSVVFTIMPRNLVPNCRENSCCGIWGRLYLACLRPTAIALTACLPRRLKLSD